MKTPAALAPTMLLDFNKNRIRIHRQTLRLLDSPEYIRIFVNPETDTIALQAGEATDVRSHRSAPKKTSFELYSRTLLQQLRLRGHWSCFQIVRLNGILIPQEGVLSPTFILN